MSALQNIIKTAMSLSISDKNFTGAYETLFGNLLNAPSEELQRDFLKGALNLAIENKVLHKLNVKLLEYFPSEIAQAWKLYRLQQISGTHPQIFETWRQNENITNAQFIGELVQKIGFEKSFANWISDWEDLVADWSCYDAMQISSLAEDDTWGHNNQFWHKVYEIAYRILKNCDWCYRLKRDEYSNIDVAQNLQMEENVTLLLSEELGKLLEAELTGYLNDQWEMGPAELISTAWRWGWMEESGETLTEALMCLCKLHQFKNIAPFVFQTLWEVLNNHNDWIDWEDDEITDALDRIGYIEYVDEEEV